MMINLEGRIALVTGSGPNIGRSICITLAKAGAFVYCNDVDADSAKATTEAVKDAGGQAEPLVFDISDPEKTMAEIEAANASRGPIDIFVNNAAITVPKGVLETTLEEFRRVTEVNFTGAFVCAQAVAKGMVAANTRGSMVFIGSTSGQRGRANAIAYCSTKGGVLNMTRAMAVDLAPHSIRVNSVSPTKTGISVGNLENAAVRLYDEIPLGRLGDPQEQANAVLFAVSDLASFMTGEDIRIDGGALATWGAKTIFDKSKAEDAK